jgi:hypothetical protein
VPLKALTSRVQLCEVPGDKGSVSRMVLHVCNACGFPEVYSESLGKGVLGGQREPWNLETAMALRRQFVVVEPFSWRKDSASPKMCHHASQ